jgi:outer membrane protein assembly factor BamB/predicted Zn-dependent protease
MHLFHVVAQRCRSAARARVLLWLITAGLFAAAAIPVQDAVGQFPGGRARRVQQLGQDASAGVYLPTDRSLSRAIARARERLGDHEYHEVLAFLQGVLARDEDSFLERAGDDRQLGIKATARQLIGELPPEGYEVYELLHGATARRQLEAGIQSGDREALAKIVRQYFHTTAGYEAALVLAEMEADQGHRLAAAELYRELMEAPRAAARLEPHLSVAAAINLLKAGQPEDAAATIHKVVETNPAAAITIAGKSTTLPAASADPIAWLVGFVGQQEATGSNDAGWLTLRGDPNRNSQVAGGRPHLRPRWEARVVNDPSVESFLSGRSDDFLQRGVVAIPGAKPIAVGDVVIMRTPENIVAIDWQTGKRIWESRDEQELQSEIASAEPTPTIDRDQWVTQGKPLEDRVWDDALMTSLSSDGKRVFVVRGMPTVRDEEGGLGWQQQFNMRNNLENFSATNQLAAYDIATQGKLAWEIDGGRNAGKLSGAFFLGAPLAIDNTLYVIAEVRSALYLIALDPSNGQVQWQQQLLGLEQSIALDPARRRAGVTPSYSGGVLVCPTAASTVVAIDVVKREFAWVYKYPRETQTPDVRNWQFQQQQAQLVRTNNQWLDSSAVITDGKVIVTPPESSEIYCLDLHSGKALWHHRQGDSLFIGGVDHGNVLLVSGQSVMACRLSDGDPAWKKETTPLPSGALPAGQGYLSEGRYYLPLTSGQIAEIDMATGSLETYSPAGGTVSLGNLICYRGSVISQSPLVLDKFEQLDVLRKRTKEAIARNANDATAIRESAELKRAGNEKPEAVKLLKRAYELAPNDLVTQEMLAELLLEELDADYASFRSDVPLLAKLIHNRQQQIDLLRLDAAGLDKAGDRLAAWDAYLRLADFTSEEPAYLRVEDKFVVRSDRWISGRLAAMWSAASPDERKALEQRLAIRRPELQNPRTAAELRHYLAHLDQLPGADGVRLALASYLIDHDRPQQAEIELLQSLPSSEQSPQGATKELLAKLVAKSGKATDRAIAEWPRGHVDSQLTPAGPGQQPRDRAVPGAMPNQGQPVSYRPLRIEEDFAPKASPTQWFISNDCSEIVGRSLLGADIFRMQIDPNNVARQYRDSNLIRGARMGHFLYVLVGGQVLAVDSRQDHPSADADLLWPSQSQDALPRDMIRPRRSPVNPQARNTRRPLYHAFGRKRLNGTSGAALGSLGPISPRGVVYQDDDELKCVDPITGAILWTRTDIPPACELFGDGELVIAADVATSVAYVLRAVDGQLLEKRERPAPEWLLTSGRNVAHLAAVSGRGNRAKLVITDIVAQKTLFETDLSDRVRYSVIEPNALAVLDSTGQFQLIDVDSGKALIDEKLEVAADSQAFYTMRSGDELFLFVTGPPQPQIRTTTQGFDSPIINGPVYAFNMRTGKALWPAPAIVRNRGMMLSQPPEVPFLVFMDRQQSHGASNETTAQLRVLCLDKRTGETVYTNDRVPDTAVPRFRVEAEREPKPKVTLEMGGSKIALAMTDRPRPPQPPANDDLDASREVVERGIRGLGARMSGALRGALERGTQDIPTRLQPKQSRPQSGNQKPAKNSNDTDDD